ncbi:MAG: hypothetical protein AABX65_04485 [Nanoarchaeota archaeon]
MKRFIIFSLIGILLVLNIQAVMAHCPLCTVAAGGGIAVARWLGVDDSIVGVFVGAFIVSTALWLGKWLNKKNIVISGAILVIASFLLTVVPFYTGGVITDMEMVKSMPEHHAILGMGAFGIDKLLTGIIFGSVFVWGAFAVSDYIKKKRGKVLFPYQGIVFMAITLAILSGIFWGLT